MIPSIETRKQQGPVRKLGRGTMVLVIASLGVLFVAEAAAQNNFPSDCVPPPGGTYAGAFHAKYADGTNVYDLSDPRHSKFTGCTPPPVSIPGSCTLDAFGSFVFAQLAVNAGPPMPVNGPANVQVQVCFSHQTGPTRFFDTEMLQLDIMGGPLLIRESPTRASLGKTAITDLGGGIHQIDSFFDIFTELSVDGGQTWLPSTDAGGNPFAGRVLIPGTVAVNPSSWSKVKVLYKQP